MKILLFIAAICASLLSGLLQAEELSEKRKAKLQSTIMSSHLPLSKRVRALKKLHADLLVKGKIHRSFCVWDPLGRNGPIFATVDDQKLRSLHYGLALDVRAYQDEQELITRLKSGDCDAGLIRGNHVGEFNRFSATLEAVGAVPTTQHLQVLMQALANPKLAPRLEQGDYVVAGVAYLGDSFLYTHDLRASSFAEAATGSIAVPEDDASLLALARQLTPRYQSQGLPQAAKQFVEQQSTALLAPIVAYQAMISGQLTQPVRILDMPLSLSTIQLVGRKDRFPTGLAQLLREDFLFKFDTYVRRVEREQSNIPDDYWQVVKPEDRAIQRQRMQKLRQNLANSGEYDKRMLKLQRKVRCRIEPGLQECQQKSRNLAQDTY